MVRVPGIAAQSKGDWNKKEAGDRAKVSQQYDRLVPYSLGCTNRYETVTSIGSSVSYGSKLRLRYVLSSALPAIDQMNFDHALPTVQWIGSLPSSGLTISMSPSR